ncbi:hypothetical protein EIN_411360 [Entamoeba invadens IP1]|uniref:Uncharacterized protein n=1 Tax=Entamoeba invadens IP1 TaxID=370355 RepID=A0A0A1U178_ENTIV|nr:hypothetical protein EIN_411360 [Entamoeba invadens IP1]ELP87783.1 hypothetical protein EIN_411360 [Entamoeba invadens IP1]|eukprot:XP_004254554.1 hypothetical protein EIN_411360 [Entamoeba invadens IP1]
MEQDLLQNILCKLPEDKQVVVKEFLIFILSQKNEDLSPIITFINQFKPGENLPPSLLFTEQQQNLLNICNDNKLKLLKLMDYHPNTPSQHASSPIEKIPQTESNKIGEYVLVKQKPQVTVEVNFIEAFKGVEKCIGDTQDKVFIPEFSKTGDVIEIPGYTVKVEISDTMGYMTFKDDIYCLIQPKATQAVHPSGVVMKLLTGNFLTFLDRYYVSKDKTLGRNHKGRFIPITNMCFFGKADRAQLSETKSAFTVPQSTPVYSKPVLPFFPQVVVPQQPTIVAKDPNTVRMKKSVVLLEKHVFGFTHKNTKVNTMYWVKWGNNFITAIDLTDNIFGTVELPTDSKTPKDPSKLDEMEDFVEDSTHYYVSFVNVACKPQTNMQTLKDNFTFTISDVFPAVMKRNKLADKNKVLLQLEYTRRDLYNTLLTFPLIYPISLEPELLKENRVFIPFFKFNSQNKSILVIDLTLVD